MQYFIPREQVTLKFELEKHLSLQKTIAAILVFLIPSMPII